MPIRQQKTLKIGLTGGIGAGKTYISSLFAKRGIAIYDSDLRAKVLMVNHEDLVLQIKDYFGENAYHKDGSLNRFHIANIVFHDTEKLNLLNNLVHPVLKQDAQQWFEQQEGIYAIQEAAILFESHMEKYMDYTIMVYAPVVIRENRVIKRDNISLSEVRARIHKQMPDEEKVKKADFVIYNDEKHNIHSQIEVIDQKLKKESLP
jgi:dephospho-CoA kinase